jgi:PAP2 superfamily
MAPRTPIGEAPAAPDVPGPARPAQVTRPAAGPTRRSRRWLARELLLIFVFAVIYEELHNHMVQVGAVAARHALDIVGVEKALGIFQEEAVQDVFLHLPGVMRSFNLYYGGTHFLVPAGALIWLAVRHPERYARARTTLAAVTGLGFLCFWLYPVAPPRLLPARFRIVDTLLTLGHAGHVANALINRAGDTYASLPSLHVAWALWCTLALYPVIRHRGLRVLVAGYPLLTTLVVVTTGNHFFVDTIAGALLAVVTWAAVEGLARSRPDWRGWALRCAQAMAYQVPALPDAAAAHGARLDDDAPLEPVAAQPLSGSWDPCRHVRR